MCVYIYIYIYILYIYIYYIYIYIYIYMYKSFTSKVETSAVAETLKSEVRHGFHSFSISAYAVELKFRTFFLLSLLLLHNSLLLCISSTQNRHAKNGTVSGPSPSPGPGQGGQALGREVQGGRNRRRGEVHGVDLLRQTALQARHKGKQSACVNARSPGQSRNLLRFQFDAQWSTHYSLFRVW